MKLKDIMTRSNLYFEQSTETAYQCSH